MPISTMPSPMKESARSTPSSSDMSSRKTFATAITISAPEAMRSTCEGYAKGQPERGIGVHLDLAEIAPQPDILALEQPPDRQRRIDEGEQRAEQRQHCHVPAR